MVMCKWFEGVSDKKYTGIFGVFFHFLRLLLIFLANVYISNFPLTLTNLLLIFISRESCYSVFNLHHKSTIIVTQSKP
jgi:hypothetical protein